MVLYPCSGAPYGASASCLRSMTAIKHLNTIWGPEGTAIYLDS